MIQKVWLRTVMAAAVLPIVAAGCSTDTSSLTAERSSSEVAETAILPRFYNVDVSTKCGVQYVLHEGQWYALRKPVGGGKPPAGWPSPTAPGSVYDLGNDRLGLIVYLPGGREFTDTLDPVGSDPVICA